MMNFDHIVFVKKVRSGLKEKNVKGKYKTLLSYIFEKNEFTSISTG